MSAITAPDRPIIEALVRSTLAKQLGQQMPTGNAPTLVVNSSARHMQIGRASCRERV